eukprot:gnl/Spiro4/28706_TR14202_c0_g1_i1.p3 gnl/Spiro4/28706_TR14202_c0_g1~~gnl/Spiro4/28706_TR14202_c0_g1_i1.p3  ORF type:complete len:101 (+),score=20.36 gnl/Spiro4/28706_TR14202_c0_g1_i1:37-303(+)
MARGGDDEKETTCCGRIWWCFKCIIKCFIGAILFLVTAFCFIFGILLWIFLLPFKSSCCCACCAEAIECAEKVIQIPLNLVKCIWDCC